MPPTFPPELLDFLESRSLDRWGGAVWREILGETDVLRPNQRGARWNPLGIEALYCSLLPETAAAEVDFLVALQSIEVSKRTRVQLEVELSRVVDLTDLSPLASFGMERADLLGKAVDRSRFIGHAVSWLGCAGLLVPSARHEGTNLVIYTNQMGKDDRVDLAS